MSGLFSRIKGKFCEKRLDESRDDSLCMSDIVECLREMGYEPVEGSRKSILKFDFGDVYYEVRYEDLRLNIRLYIFDERAELLQLYRETSDAVNNELMMVRSAVKLNGNGTYWTSLRYDVFISSKKEFKRFFPWYFKEIKDGYLWFTNWFNDMYENLTTARYVDDERKEEEKLMK